MGLLATLPLLFVLGNAERRSQTVAMARTLEWWLLALVAVIGAYAVFARPADEQLKFFYLLFVPAVWGAARFGVTGAVWSAALVQLLLIAAVQSAPYRPLTVGLAEETQARSRPRAGDGGKQAGQEAAETMLPRAPALSAMRVIHSIDLLLARGQKSSVVR